MEKTTEEWQEKLFRYLGHWSWRYVIHRYNDAHLVVADQFFLNFLNDADNSALQCKTALPETAEASVTENIKKVLVFCKQGELALVRHLQKRFPNVVVVSGTYGYALAGVDRFPRMVPYKPAAGRLFGPLNLILATPGAEAEFIAKTLEGNGLPYFHEYLGRPHSVWLEEHKGFQVSRFYDAVRGHAEAGEDKPLNLLLQTDVLDSLFRNTPFTLRHFCSFIQKVAARVLLVTTEDSLAQASRVHIMGKSKERSVWTKPASRKMIAQYKWDDLPGCISWHQHIVDYEDVFAELEECLPETLSVSLEAFLADQEVGTQKVASFFGFPVPDEVVTLDYKEGYKNAAKILPAANELRRELVDRLGIRTNLLR